MEPERKALLRDLALDIAIDRARAISVAQGHLLAAARTLDDWQHAHHSFADSKMHQWGQLIRQVAHSIPSGARELFEAITGRSHEEFDGVTGNDMVRLRLEEAGIPEDVEDPYQVELLPEEEPLVLYMRLKSETP